jgi:predicted RecA/RadA family phage recombinase
MSKNEWFLDAEHLSLPVPAGTKSGDAVIVGTVPGYAKTDRGADGNATVWMKGAPKIPVTGAITAIMQPVYIPPAGGAVTATATANSLYGYALALKGAGVGTIPVKIAQV